MKLFFASPGARFSRIDASPIRVVEKPTISPEADKHDSEPVIQTGVFVVKDTLGAVEKQRKIKSAG
jgi:hypothetical protein